ncbi:MAG: type II secretion system protein GspN [Deltaproteobacteria bacterium]|nr:type II secretion system protein GspN [Deltaproteobacteria bacterium]MBW1911512.1 type II secretion system protein GspN [Deltaproteobacteria bacterium]MBW2114451.1 type II secretion system protein GspN [Deltaproteobacteria bacterium]
MRNFQSTILRWFGYFLYAVVLTVALLYWLFPSEDLYNYFQANAKKIDSRLVLDIDQIRPCLPFGFESFGTELFFKDNPDTALFSSERITIKPRIWPLLQGRFDFGFECRAYSGDISGRVSFREGGLGGPFDGEIELRNIRIGDYKYLPVLLGRSVEGTLDGDIRYLTKSGPLINGSGKANFRLRHGRVRFSRPVLNIRFVDIRDLETEMLIEDQKINVTRFCLRSRQMNITLRGNINLEREFAKSRLGLKGELELLEQRRFAFQVEGVISKPKLIFSSSQVE